MKNLILDVNVILDLWLGRIPEEEQLLIAELIANVTPNAAPNTYHCWFSSSSLPVLEYITRKELKKSGLQPTDAIRATRDLIAGLIDSTRLLSNYGFHQADAIQLSNDLEDAQIVLAASSLQGDTAIVTNEKRFQTGGKIEQVKLQEVAEWLAGLDRDKPIDFIDLKTQQDALRPTLEKNLHKVLHHGQYIMGPEVKELEEKLAAYVGVKHCISASSGTDTLLIAMMALGIVPGDEVITTPFTFIATGEMIALLGAKPVFVDIDPKTYNIDPSKIEAAITPKTKAIMPVSLYGQCADMDAINAIADQHGLPVIEDAAQSFGATYKGRKSCGLSTIGSTSFFPSKPLGGYGDGGALFTNDDAMAKAMKEIRVHGQDRRYHHPRIGINGRLDTLQAAILLAKFERFEWEVEQRQKVGAGYTALLSEQCPSIVPPYLAPECTSVFAQYTVQVKERDALVKRLNNEGIPTAVHYPVPLHVQPAYQCFGNSLGDFPVAEWASTTVLSLPMGPDLTDADQSRVIAALHA